MEFCVWVGGKLYVHCARCDQRHLPERSCSGFTACNGRGEDAGLFPAPLKIHKLRLFLSASVGQDRTRNVFVLPSFLLVILQGPQLREGFGAHLL